MKPFLLALSIFFALTHAVAAQSMNVMTWNIRYDNPRDGENGWPNRKDWVAEIITKHHVDVAGFQEVLVGQLHDLQERLTAMDSYGVGRNDGKIAGEFTPIFYRKDRFELIEQSTFWLSPTPDQPGSKGWDAALPRIASWMKLKDRQTQAVFYVVNTHFDHQGAEARTQSAALLVKFLREKWAASPVILTGDFNTTPKTPPYNTVIGRETNDQAAFFDTYERSAQKPIGPDSTWNGFQKIEPGQRIDFIFTTKSVNVQRLQILDDQRDGRFPSDHLPIIANVKLTSPG